MIKFRKKQVLVPINKPLYFHAEANDRHNEITLVTVQYAIPLNSILQGGINSISNGAIRAVLKSTRSLKDIKLVFNNMPQSPAFIFTVKAKTERRGNDIHNQGLADKIVLTKATIRACVIARRVIRAIEDFHCQEVHFLRSLCNMLENYTSRETAYIHKIT